MKKVIFLGIMCLMALTMQAQSYVNLGLPSKTKWKSQNEKGLYTCEEADSQFGMQLPTRAHWEELKSKCKWSWTGSGYKVTGPNGKSIVLPAEGIRNCGGIVNGEGSCGSYWSCTPYGSKYAWGLYFNSSGPKVDYYLRSYGYSVRLIQD